MPTYEIWNEDNTELLNTITNPDPVKLDKMAGYLLVVEPVLLQTQKKGEMTFSATERSWFKVAKTQEELDADAAIAAAAQEAADNQAILELKKDSQYILALIGKNNEWVDSKVDNSTGGETSAEIVENIRTALKEIVYTQRDVAEILNSLYKLGRI